MGLYSKGELSRGSVDIEKERMQKIFLMSLDLKIVHNINVDD